MNGFTLSKELGVAASTVKVRLLSIWNEYPKHFTEEQEAEARQYFIDNPVISNTGKQNPDTHKRYLKALGIIKRDGYIETTQLLKIMGVPQVYPVENTFDREDTPIYDDILEEIVIRKKKNKVIRHKVHRLLKPLFEQWKQESKFNNGYITDYNTHTYERRIK